MPVVINKLSDAQVRAVKGTMAEEIRSSLVQLDDTRRIAIFHMDNPVRWMQEKIDTYDKSAASHRVMLILMRKVRQAQENQP